MSRLSWYSANTNESHLNLSSRAKVIEKTLFERLFNISRTNIKHTGTQSTSLLASKTIDPSTQEFPTEDRSESPMSFASDDELFEFDKGFQNVDELKNTGLSLFGEKTLFHDGSKIGFIKVIDSEAVLIVSPDVKDSNIHENMCYFAATVNDDLHSVHSEGGTLVKKVLPIMTTDEKDFKRNVKNLKRDSELLEEHKKKKPRSFELKCICNSVSISEEHSQLIGQELMKIKCNCGDQLHLKCVDSEQKRKMHKFGFKCAKCTVKDVTSGLQWSSPAPTRGGRYISNTCTIDNHLTALVIFESLQNNDLYSYFPNDKSHDQLKSTLQLIKNGKYNDAQVKYYDELKKFFENLPASDSPMEVAPIKTNDLFGSIDDKFIFKHKEGFKFRKTSTCSNISCESKVDLEASEINLGFYFNDPSSLGAIQGLDKLPEVFGGFQKKCRTCTSGTLTSKKIILSEDQWCIHFSTLDLKGDASDRIKSDILNDKLPKTLVCQAEGEKEVRFGLACVVINEPQYHNVSLQWVPSAGAFVYYDGMARDGRIRKFHSSDLFKSNRQLHSINYFRLRDQ